MNQSREDVVEALLHAQFDGPVLDEGFSRQVMQRLPQHRRRVTWPLWSGLLMGACASWLALFFSPLLRLRGGVGRMEIGLRRPSWGCLQC